MSEQVMRAKNDKRSSRRPLAGWFVVSIALAVGLSACGKGDDAGGAQQEQRVPAGYITMKASDVGLMNELPGRLQAYRVADVRARVPGVLQRRLFTEGSDVKAGQRLFQIDDAPYRAALQTAQATLTQAQASLMQTKAQAERYKPLVAVNAVSKQDYDNALAAQKTSEANINAANAAITTARIDLGYAAVTSPISGRIGQALVTEGALVGQGDVTLLAVVQQIDPLYVNFTQSATDVIKLQQDVRSGQYKVAGDGSIPITVVLSDGTVYEHQGKLLFTDLTVDETTGQVTLRATLPNPDKLLLPGLYVRVQLDQVQVEHAYLVPQQAVTRSAVGDSVYVINADDTVAPRKVVVSGRSGQNWVVTAGLQDGDRVMVDGFQNWQMKMQQAMQQQAKTGHADPVHVNPVPTDSKGEAQAPGAAQAAEQPNATTVERGQEPAAAPAAANQGAAAGEAAQPAQQV